jgi:hypothetical protein
MAVPALPSNRSFGFVFVVVFAVLGVYSWWRGSQYFAVPLGLSALIGSITLAKPEVLTPFNRAWMKFGELLHRVISPIVLGAIFYGVITPYGTVMRLFGRDALRRKFQRELPSYWIERTPPGPDGSSLPNQF